MNILFIVICIFYIITFGAFISSGYAVKDHDKDNRLGLAPIYHNREFTSVVNLSSMVISIILIIVGCYINFILMLAIVLLFIAIPTLQQLSVRLGLVLYVRLVYPLFMKDI